MTWNYRIIKTNYEDGTSTYEIHEVYYKEGNIVSWTGGGFSPFGESLEELKQDFEQMKDAFDKPVLVNSDDGLVDLTEPED